MEGGDQGIGVHSLIRSTLKVEGGDETPRWGLGRMTSWSIIHMDLHKLNNKLVSVYFEHFWCTTEPHAYTNSQDLPWPELGGSHQLPPYNILYD
jgi:hypothetical protein